jgi:hypothetical protein
VVALLCLIARITISFYAFRRLQVADGFAILAFTLLVLNGVCLQPCNMATKLSRHGSYRPQASALICQNVSMQLILKGSHHNHVLGDVRTSRRQRR